MRVLHLGLESSSERSGGLNRYFEELVHAQRRAGIDAVGVALGSGTTDDEAMLHVPRRGSLVRRAVELDRAAGRLAAPDVADLHFAGTAIVAVRSSLRATPTVVHFQGPWADESAHGGARAANVVAKRVIERSVYRRADRLVTLSHAFASLLVERYGVAPWRVVTIPPGVDVERFTPGDAARSRQLLGLAAEARVVLAVRRLVPRMGIDLLLDAWAWVDRRPDDVLVVIGDGPLRGALQRRAGELGIDANLLLPGRVDDDALVEWYRAADLTVVPTVALEGFGLVVLESAACGVPVVATDAAGLPEALELLGAGPPVARGDAGALAAAIDRRLAAPADRDERASLRAAACACSWEHVAKQHVELYESVLHGERVPFVVVLDHTSVLSGGELAMVRAIGGLRGAARVHVILAADGPLRPRLEAAGASVEVLALPESVRGLRRGSVRPGGVSPRAVLTTARYTLALSRRLRALRPDVVHANSLKSGLYGGVAARLARVASVWHVRDHVAAPYLPGFAVGLVRAATRALPDVVVANSASTLRTVRARRGRVVPSPVDPSVLDVARDVDRDRPLRVTVLGRLAPWKGQDLALRAFARAFPSGPATLRVVGAALFGEDEYAAGLPRLAEELGVADRVRFDGFVEDVAGVLGQTDVFVHSARSPEPFGQVVVEAMGAGCAVVVANRGGPADVVTDGFDGLQYGMDDEGQLAACLRRLADDPELRERLGAAARETARAYLPEQLAPLLLDAWSLAMGRARDA